LAKADALSCVSEGDCHSIGMCRQPVHLQNLRRVQSSLRTVPDLGTLSGMTKTPLRDYLDGVGQTAEAFAAAHNLSAWSVRHWARGDKEPSLGAQIDMEKATGGKITPADWLTWSIARRETQSEAA
jgi:hypothetical protein